MNKIGILIITFLLSLMSCATTGIVTSKKHFVPSYGCYVDIKSGKAVYKTYNEAWMLAITTKNGTKCIFVSEHIFSSAALNEKCTTKGSSTRKAN